MVCTCYPGSNPVPSPGQPGNLGCDQNLLNKFHSVSDVIDALLYKNNRANS